MQETRFPWVGKIPAVGNGYHSSILAWTTPQKRNLVVCSPWGSKELDTTERFTLSLPGKNVGFS